MVRKTRMHLLRLARYHNVDLVTLRSMYSFQDDWMIKELDKMIQEQENAG